MISDLINIIISIVLMSLYIVLMLEFSFPLWLGIIIMLL